MYLSRLILNPHNRGVQRELANPYELHRTLMTAFPEELPNHERVLFRVETDRTTGVPAVLVQSHLEADWGKLAARQDYLLPEAAWPPNVFANPAQKPFQLALQMGQRLAFRLRANPTVTRQGKRHALYREEAQRAWLERQGRRGGFRVLRVNVVREGDTSAWIARDTQRLRATHFAVCFDGLLQVTDPAILWQTVQAGIGPAKGFGFGLLSLGPAPA